MSENLREGLKNSPSLKVLVVLAITLLLLIPRFNIESLIGERQGLQNEVIDDIQSKWADEQTFSGPVLTIPYEALENIGTTNEKVSIRHIHLLPEELVINSSLTPEERKISIYKAILYNSDLNYTGLFDISSIKQLNIDSSKIHWDRASLNFGITDPRGITSVSPVKWNGTNSKITPGLSSRDVKFNSGLHADVLLEENIKKFNFSGEISFKGSSGAYFIPFGKTTTIRVKSPWKDPGFNGAFLPTERIIDEQGFSSTWNILEYNRSFPQVWDNYFTSAQEWRLGVDLIDQVDVYQKIFRSIKYAMLIITLTFTFFFFFEILSKLKIHPIQYSIVGVALMIFYVLLLALSEHLSFGLSFFLSATGIVLLSSYYFYFISKSKKATVLFSGLFSSIYFFIYVILNMESYSLLMGSLGLFVLIALIMFYTRTIDWYNLNQKNS